ncbi:hypothetical protein [Microcella sp.]|uniref:hypothetical protein n=1 Tax=Microcella sp. TaxID=1913979 RepID=UPI0039188313
MPRTPAPDDDAALRWDELDDPSYVESDAAIAARAPAVAGDDAEAGAASLTDEAPDAGTEPPAPGGPALGLRLLTGLFALVYLAWSVGWIIGIGLVPLSGPTVLLEVLYQFSEFLAIIASALWFAAVVALTRDGRAAHRIGWLALGTLVLVPWPVVLGVLA